jgi:hypothetical protein
MHSVGVLAPFAEWPAADTARIFEIILQRPFQEALIDQC